MTRIIVLLNLKPGKSDADYRQWALTTDLPTVNALGSVEKFELFKAEGILGGGASPYHYVEVIDIVDMAAFLREAGTDAMAKIAAEFQAWADPIFIVTRKIEAAA